MESASEKLLNFTILPPQTKKAFDFLSSQDWLKGSGWYLAGGTALALRANHRNMARSIFCRHAMWRR
jgi:hypothetical protein